MKEETILTLGLVGVGALLVYKFFGQGLSDVGGAVGGVAQAGGQAIDTGLSDVNQIAKDVGALFYPNTYDKLFNPSKPAIAQPYNPYVPGAMMTSIFAGKIGAGYTSGGVAISPSATVKLASMTGGGGVTYTDTHGSSYIAVGKTGGLMSVPILKKH